jgi:hypothetical protein
MFRYSSTRARRLACAARHLFAGLIEPFSRQLAIVASAIVRSAPNDNLICQTAPTTSPSAI